MQTILAALTGRPARPGRRRAPGLPSVVRFGRRLPLHSAVTR
jgi:hypothetical protein